jgi:hypothetical protein
MSFRLSSLDSEPMIFGEGSSPELSRWLGPVPIPPVDGAKLRHHTPEWLGDSMFDDVTAWLRASFHHAVKFAADATIQASSSWNMSLCAPEGGSPFLTTADESMLRIAALANG